MANPDSTTTQNTPVPDLRYVHLPGRAIIGRDDEGRITIVLLDKDRKPINKDNPLIFSAKIVAPINTVDRINAIEFIDIDLVAEFDKNQFETHKATLQKAIPSLGEWDTLEPSDNDADMNPIGEPPRQV